MLLLTGYCWGEEEGREEGGGKEKEGGKEGRGKEKGEREEGKRQRRDEGGSTALKVSICVGTIYTSFDRDEWIDIPQRAVWVNLR